MSALPLTAMLAICGLALIAAALLYRRHAQLGIRLADTVRKTHFFQAVAENAKDGVIVHGLDGRVVWANPAYCALMGRPLSDMIGRNPLSFALPADLALPASEIAAYRLDPDDPLQRETVIRRNVRLDGTEFWNQISIAHCPAAGTGGDDMVIMICRDVSDQVARESALREASDRLRHSASHDPLTGLANRAGFLRFAETALTQRQDGCMGVLHIDLDRFKEINDIHGHAAGDAVLVHVADALRTVLRPGDLAARMGGDEFLVACPGLPDLGALADIGNRVLHAISGSVVWQERTLLVRASIGAELAAPGETDLGALVLRSDFALYEAKRAGRDQLACYDETVHQRHSDVRELAADLIDAVRKGGLSFVFQPILDLSVGQITTLETLVRWNHPHRGPLSPAEFLPLAEELGLMADLDFCAIQAALRLKARLNAARPSSLTVTLNASAALLSHSDFLPRLRKGLIEHDLSPPEVGIEVLETVVFGAPGARDQTSEVISDLRTDGHPVMLDDFGVGYAGLAHLANLDVSGIKIDLSLVQAAKTDPTSVQILETMIDLCRRLGLTSIAEGVDTVWMATRLQDMGCSRVQGWWLSPALPADDIVRWLDGHALPPIAEPAPPLYQAPITTAPGTADGQLPVRLSHGSGVKSLSRRKKSV